jgi:hypothetical protein
MTEKQLENAILQALTSNGHFVIKLRDQNSFRDGTYQKSSPFQIRGVSDLVVYLDHGVAVWLEIKTPTGRQSKYQKAFEKRITDLGHHYVIARSVGDAVVSIGKIIKTLK